MHIFWVRLIARHFVIVTSRYIFPMILYTVYNGTDTFAFMTYCTYDVLEYDSTLSPVIQSHVEAEWFYQCKYLVQVLPAYG